MLIRLNKYLSDSGVCSRRKADEYILAGDVGINGATVKVLGTKIDPEKDSVYFQGELVKAAENYIYYALYKPKGVVSTASDELGRKTVLDLVPKSPRVYPVGRLDEDSEGLIILTNDGALAQELTHPSYQHKKEYEVTARKSTKSVKFIKSIKSIKSQDSELIDFEGIKKKFENGIVIDSKLMKADKVFAPTLGLDGLLTFRLILHTGYNRQIRKMCAKIGLAVIKLVRTNVANLSLLELKLSDGDFVSVKRDEIL